MTNDLLKHKGYFGSIQYSADDKCLYGKVEFIDDLVLYEGTSVEEVEAAFRDAVDNYLDECKQAGTQPNVTCKGSFNVRVGEKLHRDLAVEAMRNQLSLNEFIKATLQERIYGSGVRKDLASITEKLPAVAEMFRHHLQPKEWLISKQLEETESFVGGIATRESTTQVTWKH